MGTRIVILEDFDGNQGHSQSWKIDTDHPVTINDLQRAGLVEVRRRQGNGPLYGHLRDASKEKGSGPPRCYLTTACIDAMDLPDNCFELETLRGFRDKVLLPEPSGRKAVEEYYQVAPDIVQGINEQSGSKGVWQSTYRDIRTAIGLIFRGDFNGAFNHYKDMTERLKSIAGI